MKTRKISEALGFTLVELLVVIGIIALLIGILFPAFKQARAQATNIKCQSNLRQLYIATALYANDNRDVFPSAAVTTSASLRRGAGVLDPADPGAGGEKLGLPALYALYHYLPAGSAVWNCPAQSQLADRADWGCSYRNNTYLGSFDKLKSLARSRAAHIAGDANDNQGLWVFECTSTVSPAPNNKTDALDYGTYGNMVDSSTPLGGYKNGSSWKYAYLYPHYFRGVKQTGVMQSTQFVLMNGSQNAVFRALADGAIVGYTVSNQLNKP